MKELITAVIAFTFLISQAQAQENFACMGGIAPGITICVGPGNFVMGQPYVMAVYSTMEGCIADSCNVIVIPPSWDCNPLTGCYDPGTGNGQYATMEGCIAECGDNGVGCYTDSGEFYGLGQVLEVSDDWCENFTCSPVDAVGENYEFILNSDLYPWECDPIWEDGCYDDDGTFYLPGEVLVVSDDWCENYTCYAGFAGFMLLLNSDLNPLECEIDPNLGCFENGEFFPVGASYYLSECEYILCEGDMEWSATIVIDGCETNDCIDPSLIDLNAACYDLWDPVCGCDGVTYSNDCYAINFAGVTSFTPGPCNDVPGGCTYIQALNYQPDASWDDGSCLFAPCNSDCAGDIDGDSSVTVGDILQLLGNFGAICQ